ncbi:hypothetical protein RIF25_11585 [Thermosynechococcaceae cyanobacterium BACA0444]|uniref:Uncharacterized protein n=1 Tax=Pseudocalidococcus azoricus BACA0444 TaxID=2918990 RepID=A0AAE4JYW8_9CYAN|nr:hypothetical protein [Pseudocalidococcus azoricus]MDS3861449.1 hypothetical protein [Pseudocalidococcus azoricus BACA0444]
MVTAIGPDLGLATTAIVLRLDTLPGLGSGDIATLAHATQI